MSPLNMRWQAAAQEQAEPADRRDVLVARAEARALLAVGCTGGVASKHQVQGMVDAWMDRDRQLYGAAQSTVNAIIYVLREQGLVGLHDERNRCRLAELSGKQIDAVIEALAKIQAKYPATITDELMLLIDEYRP